jgi:hypothetical protein
VTVQRLKVLAREINDLHETAMASAKGAGEAMIEGAKAMALTGQKLNTVKDETPHGYWMGWVEEECYFSSRTARRYMAFANQWEDLSARLDEMSKLATIGHFERIELIRHLIKSVMYGDEPEPEPRDSVKLLLAFADSIEKRFERDKVSALPLEVKAQLRAKLEKLLEGLR